MIEARDESNHLGSIVRFNDGVSPSAAVVHLPQDFVVGDVRWPRKQGVGDLEGRRVMVPSKVFGQSDRDGHGGYAGTVKRDTGWRVTIHFFIDGKDITFACEQVRDWLLDAQDKAANAAWEEQAPSTTPARWPCDVIFCSFPLQHGIHPSLLKRFCALSELMAGVDIRKVDAGHPLAGTRYSLGLYATRDFRRGVTIGQYSGMLEPSGPCRRWSQTSEGRFDIALDTAEALSSAQGLTLDAKFVGNEGRIINDFRGIAEEHNVRFRTSSHPTKGVWVDIVVTRAITHGEEILADYDYGMRRDDDQPSTTRKAAPSSASTSAEAGAASKGKRKASSAQPPPAQPPPAKRRSAKAKANEDEDEQQPQRQAESEEASGAAEEAAEAELVNFACNKCLRTGDACSMLLCDGLECDVALHTYCCDPPLAVAPAGDWYCFVCSTKRQATHQLTGRQQMRYLRQLEDARRAEEARRADELVR
jgi:hypothetical protein